MQVVTQVKHLKCCKNASRFQSTAYNLSELRSKSNFIGFYLRKVEWVSVSAPHVGCIKSSLWRTAELAQTDEVKLTTKGKTR